MLEWNLVESRTATPHEIRNRGERATAKEIPTAEKRIAENVQIIDRFSVAVLERKVALQRAKGCASGFLLRVGCALRGQTG